MEPTKAAKHDERRHPAPTRQVPQGQTHGPRQPEQVSESSPPLHRYLGNSYVQAMTGKKPRLGRQTKLKVNEPGDSHEREADRVADQVLATPAQHDIGGAPPRIQRLSGPSHGQVDGAPPASVDQALTSAGTALEPALRQDMEQRFGHDFSRVRVHTGAAAAQSAEDVNAHAYTIGHDIVLGAGRFGTETHEGRRLIAHELTHVVQQSGAVGGVHQNHEGDGFPPSSIAPSQPVVTTLQRKAKRSPGDAPPQQPVKGKPARQTSSSKVSFVIHFDKPLTRSQFMELADMTIYGQRTPGEWKGVPEQLKASDSPVVVLVPASTLEPGLRTRITALPAHIQNFLMANKGAAGSYEDLQSVVNAGFLLEVAGVTEDELELSLLESPKTETSDLVTWAQDFLARRQEQEESERKHEEREKKREAEEKALEKWRKRFAKYPDAVLDEKIAELRKEPESGTAKDWLPRFEKERARRRDVRRAKPVTRPETVDQAVSMLEEAWRDAEKEDVPDVKRALELVSRIDEWLQETASSDKYDKYFEGFYRTVARQTVGPTKEQIHSIRFKLQRQGEDNWNRPTYLGGHWELGINSLKYAREHLEVMGAKKTLKETSLHSLQETTTRILKYEAAGYAAVVAAPVVIGAAIKVAPLVTTEAITAAGLRVAPRLMFWVARNPILATEVGTAVVGTALQVGEDKYLDPVQLIFNLLHIYRASLPGRGRSGPPAPNVPRQEAEPDFIINGAPKVDRQTGKITASVIEKASGRQLDAEVNVTTGSGQITDRKTREVVGIISNGQIGRPAPALPQPSQAPTKAPTASPLPQVPSTARTPAPPAATNRNIGPSAPAPQLAGKTQDPPPAQVSVPIVSAPRPKNENITARTDIEKARDKRAAATRRPQAQTQRQVLAATGGMADVAPAKVIGSNAQGNAAGGQIVASGEGKPPGSGTPVPGSVHSSETNAPTRSRTPSGTRSSGEFDENDPTNVDVLPAGASPEPSRSANQNVVPGTAPAQVPSAPEVAPPAPSRRVHPNVIPRPVPEQAPPAPEVAPPAPSRGVHPNVIPRPAPAQPPPAPGVVPPAPSGRVHPNVIPRPAPAQPAPAAPAAPSPRQPGSPEDDFENAPTLVSPRQPADPDYEPQPSLVRRSGRDTAENLRAVSGEITEPPSGASPTATSTAREPAPPGARPEPQTDSPEPPVKQPAGSGEPSARAPASKTPDTHERFDFRSLPVPEQHKGAKDKVQVFGTQVIKWGAGPKEAQTLTDMLRSNSAGARAYIENLRRAGVTPEMARAWADAYRHEHERAKTLVRTLGVPMNKTPESRVTLMDLIASLL